MGNIADRLENPITDKDTEVGEGNNLRYGVSSMQGWRTSMEDRHNLIGSFKDVPNLSLFGVYDGHGGVLTSEYISKHLPQVFESRKEFQDYKNLSQTERDDVKGIKLLKSALIATFLDIDAAMLKVKNSLRAKSPTSIRTVQDGYMQGEKDHTIKVERSGSTCLIALVTPSHLICANAGDSRACFRKDGKTLPLSFDHKPMNAAEHSRIKNAGGTVSLRRVDGDLAVSRGLGDFQFKQRADLPPEKQKVSSIPDVTIYPRNIIKDEFLVLACDGIWDVVSNEECIELVQQIFDEGERDIGLVCEEMLDICFGKESRDNMSIIVVTLPGINIGNGSGVEGRREERLRTLKECEGSLADNIDPKTVPVFTMVKN